MHIILGIDEHFDRFVLVSLEIDGIEFFASAFDVLVHVRDIDESSDVLEHFLDFLANCVGIDLLNLFLEDFDFLF